MISDMITDGNRAGVVFSFVLFAGSKLGRRLGSPLRGGGWSLCPAPGNIIGGRTWDHYFESGIISMKTISTVVETVQYFMNKLFNLFVGTEHEVRGIVGRILSFLKGLRYRSCWRRLMWYCLLPSHP